MKRLLVFVAVAAVAVGGATAAWAHGTERPRPAREAVRACIEQARAADPDADRATLREAAKPCLAELKAKFRECLRQAREAHPGDRPAIRQAVRDCMTE